MVLSGIMWQAVGEAFYTWQGESMTSVEGERKEKNRKKPPGHIIGKCW